MRRQTPEINAGSMADIAFLLLIFWLVATTITPDRGYFQKLENNETKVKIAVPTKAKDILRVLIDEDGNYIVDDEKLSLEDMEIEILNAKAKAGYKAKMLVSKDYEAPFKAWIGLITLGEELNIKTIENEIHTEELPETEGGSN